MAAMKLIRELRIKDADIPNVENVRKLEHSITNYIFQETFQVNLVPRALFKIDPTNSKRCSIQS